MRKTWFTPILCAVMLLMVSVIVQASAVNSYWHRMSGGFPNSVAVHEYVYEYRGPELEITARVPQLVGVASPTWQTEFNKDLRDRLDTFVDELKDMASEAWKIEEGHRPFLYEGIVDFEVKLNQGGILSVAVVNYMFTGGAHGMTYFDYINVDLTCGQHISFDDLFDSDEELARAAAIIDARIAEEPENFFIEGFTAEQFHEDQGFFLQDNQAVICFGLYELAPYSSGIQEFAISAP